MLKNSARNWALKVSEIFNILNHTNFLAPGFLNTFGQNNSGYVFDGSALPTALNQTYTTSRQIQLGVKLVWVRPNISSGPHRFLNISGLTCLQTNACSGS